MAKHVTSMLGIERLHTTAYHPQTNGVLERLHTTLEAMLAKAHAEGMDWVRQLPHLDRLPIARHVSVLMSLFMANTQGPLLMFTKGGGIRSVRD